LFSLQLLEINTILELDWCLVVFLSVVKFYYKNNKLPTIWNSLSDPLFAVLLLPLFELLSKPFLIVFPFIFLSLYIEFAFS